MQTQVKRVTPRRALSVARTSLASALAPAPATASLPGFGMLRKCHFKIYFRLPIHESAQSV